METNVVGGSNDLNNYDYLLSIIPSFYVFHSAINK